MTEIVFIDLFSGIGGFAEGFRRAGLAFKYHAFSEVDKNAISIYKKHFPEAKELGDVRTIRDFSAIRNQRGCRWSSLSDFLAKIYQLLAKGEDLKALEAGYSLKQCGLSENCNPIFLSLRTSKVFSQVTKDRTLSAVCKKLPTLGIMTASGNLSILAGFYPKIESGFTLSALLEDKPDAKYFLSSTAVSRILGYQHNELAALPRDISGQQQDTDRFLLNVKSIKKATMKNPQATRINTIDGNSVALQSCAGGMGAKTGLYCVPRGKRDGGFKDSDTCPTITANAFQENNFIVPVMDVTRGVKNQNGRRLKSAGDPSFTLTTQGEHGIYDGVDIRRLTPLECERLQGFPDGWTETGENGQKMSDTARYKALGNAVSVCFPELIAKSLFMENEMTADVIQFPQKKKENLNAVRALFDTVRKLHDEEGYSFTSSELKKNDQGQVVLTVVMDKPEPDDIPDITA